jgi:hypothetical protein
MLAQLFFLLSNPGTGPEIILSIAKAISKKNNVKEQGKDRCRCILRKLNSANLCSLLSWGYASLPLA